MWDLAYKKEETEDEIIIEKNKYKEFNDFILKIDKIKDDLNYGKIEVLKNEEVTERVTGDSLFLFEVKIHVNDNGYIFLRYPHLINKIEITIFVDGVEYSLNEFSRSNDINFKFKYRNYLERI